MAAMTDDILNDDLDFMLSQVAEEMENEYKCEQDLNNLTISQYITSYFDDDDLKDLTFDVGYHFDTNITELSELELESDNSDREKLQPEQKRFGDPVGQSEIDMLLNSQKNKNTEKNTKWAIEVFNKWREVRTYNNTIPQLDEMDAETMNLCLQKFVIEVRKQDGQEYPPRSLYYITCGLLHFLRDRDIYDKNFLDEHDNRFAVLQKVLDANMKELLSRGFGTKVKQADPILTEDEEKIWEAQVFGMHSAQNLQYTVFFYNCKLFGLCAFDEHRSLECEQFEIGSDNHRKYVHFIGRSNKIFKGGIKQMQLQNKDIKHYCTDGTRCIADYYEKYLTALGNRGYFYRRPLAGGIVRYGEQVVGVNKIKGLMKEITTKTGLQGNYTNHSGKRTCATQLYIAGIPEQEIMARTGHRTETAVRKYKRSSSQRHEELSKVVKSENNSESEPMEACCSRVITDKKVPLSALKDITNLEK